MYWIFSLANEKIDFLSGTWTSQGSDKIIEKKKTDRITAKETFESLPSCELLKGIDWYILLTSVEILILKKWSD